MLLTSKFGVDIIKDIFEEFGVLILVLGVYLGDNDITEHQHSNKQILRFIPIYTCFYKFDLDVNYNNTFVDLTKNTIQILDKNPKNDSDYSVIQKIENNENLWCQVNTVV